MSKKSITKIFLGILLIWLAMISVATVLFWPDVRQRFFPNIAVLFAQDPPPAGLEQRVEDIPGAVPPEQTRGTQDSGGSNTREGFLWIDKESSQYMITLGKVHGLAAGARLTVYDGENEAGQVAVDRVLEAVSYVHPAETSMNLVPGNYYRVVME